jgi:hypothetical protein
MTICFAKYIQVTGYRIQDTGYRLQVTGYRVAGYKIIICAMWFF